jgi:hypothetical protein
MPVLCERVFILGLLLFSTAVQIHESSATISLLLPLLSIHIYDQYPAYLNLVIIRTFLNLKCMGGGGDGGVWLSLVPVSLCAWRLNLSGTVMYSGMRLCR